MYNVYSGCTCIVYAYEILNLHCLNAILLILCTFARSQQPLPSSPSLSQVEQSDSSYMPSVVAVLAGNNIESLREIKQVSVSSTCRECVLVTGLTEVSAWKKFNFMAKIVTF